MTTTRSTPESDAAERAVADRLELAWGCTFDHLERFDPIDWLISVEHNAFAFGELKCRDIDVDTYETIYLAVHKLNALRERAKRTRRPALFIVGFRDGQIRWIDARHVDDRDLIIAGREDRPDMPHDREPIVLVPVAAMHTIWGD